MSVFVANNPPRGVGVPGRGGLEYLGEGGWSTWERGLEYLGEGGVEYPNVRLTNHVCCPTSLLKRTDKGLLLLGRKTGF